MPDNPIPSVRSYETLVGQVVIAWANIERVLDVYVAIDQGTGGREARRTSQQPHGRKIGNLRDAIATNSRFAPFAEDLAAILDTVEARKDDRHRLVHGMVQRFLDEPPGGVEIHRAILGLEKEERITLTSAELDAMVPAAEGIGQDLMNLPRQAAPAIGSIGGGYLGPEHRRRPA